MKETCATMRQAGKLIMKAGIKKARLLIGRRAALQKTERQVTFIAE
ncbi:hypothetical protein [Bacillus daqingensis]